MGLLNMPYWRPAECIIEVGGRPIADLYPFVSSISVNATRDSFSEATIEFISPADEKDHWLVADDARLATQAEIVIMADFKDATEEVFRGEILTLAPSYPSDAGQARVQLICRDDSIKLDRKVKTKTWGTSPAGTTDFAILGEIARDAGLQVHPMSAPGAAGIVKLQTCSDIAFLRRRALANGYELIFAEKQIYFGPMRVAIAPQPKIMVYAGHRTNCLSFSPVNQATTPRKIAYARRDAKGDPGAVTVVTSDLPVMGARPAGGAHAAEQQGFLSRTSLPSDAEAKARAQALANIGDMTVKVDGELDGSLYGHVLRVGEPVEVDGVGDQFSGVYYVDSVTHSFETTGYRQGFKLLRNALGRKGGAAGSVLAAVLNR